jgi:hypothetical protein
VRKALLPAMAALHAPGPKRESAGAGLAQPATRP